MAALLQIQAPCIVIQLLRRSKRAPPLKKISLANFSSRASLGGLLRAEYVRSKKESQNGLESAQNS
jgi:hypothetical protein